MTHVYPVGARFEGEVGTVVEYERHAGLPADVTDRPREADEISGFEVLLAELDDVYSTRDARGDERLDVRSVGGTEIEPASFESGPLAQRAAFFFGAGASPWRPAFISCLKLRTAARLFSSKMSATDR